MEKTITSSSGKAHHFALPQDICAQLPTPEVKTGGSRAAKRRARKKSNKFDQEQQRIQYQKIRPKRISLGEKNLIFPEKFQGLMSDPNFQNHDLLKHIKSYLNTQALRKLAMTCQVQYTNFYGAPFQKDIAQPGQTQQWTIMRVRDNESIARNTQAASQNIFENQSIQNRPYYTIHTLDKAESLIDIALTQYRFVSTEAAVESYQRARHNLNLPITGDDESRLKFKDSVKVRLEALRAKLDENPDLFERIIPSINRKIVELSKGKTSRQANHPVLALKFAKLQGYQCLRNMGACESLRKEIQQDILAIHSEEMQSLYQAKFEREANFDFKKAEHILTLNDYNYILKIQTTPSTKEALDMMGLYRQHNQKMGLNDLIDIRIKHLKVLISSEKSRYFSGKKTKDPETQHFNKLKKCFEDMVAFCESYGYQSQLSQINECLRQIKGQLISYNC